jgi:hypothetical protein
VEVKRDKYDKVQKWLRKHEGATMEQAFKATKVTQGGYYGQKKAIEKRGKALEPVSYEQEALVPLAPEVSVAGPVRPGMVALVGAPEDLSRLLASLTGGGGR